MAKIKAGGRMDAIITGKPYPVTAAITLANNPLLALPNSKRVFEALQALQLYVVMYAVRGAFPTAASMPQQSVSKE